MPAESSGEPDRPLASVVAGPAMHAAITAAAAITRARGRCCLLPDTSA